MKYELGQEVRVEGVMTVTQTRLSWCKDRMLVVESRTKNNGLITAYVPESWVSPLEVQDETV